MFILTVKYWFKFLVLFFCLSSLSTNAQYTTVGQGAFTSTTFGPMRSTTDNASFSRHAIIYPAASLNNLKHGDTIRSLEFYKNTIDSLRGTINFKIYLQMVSYSNWGNNALYWNDSIKNANLFYDGNPKTIVGLSPGYIRFNANINKFVYDTTKGKHLAIFLDYNQSTNQSADITWAYDNDLTATGFSSNNENKFYNGINSPPDSLRNSNIRKPHIRINHPRLNKNIELANIYSLGSIANTYFIDEISFRIFNSGKNTVIGQRAFLDIQQFGSSVFRDTILLDSLPSFEGILLTQKINYKKSIGAETLKITLENDDNNSDNELSIQREITQNYANHADPFLAYNGGIGFGGSDGDFVAKFEVDSSIKVKEISLDFNTVGRDFQLGIWSSDSAHLPNQLIYISDTLTSQGGQFIQNLNQTVTVDSNFFVGIRQVGTTNVGFSFQVETPIRDNTFYFTAPAGNTEWTNFAPGFNFKFGIQPRVAQNVDYAALSISNPVNQDTLNFDLTDTIFPQISFRNLSLENTIDSALLRVEVFSPFNQRIFLFEDSVKLERDSSLEYTLPQGFVSGFTGKHSIRLSIIHPKDGAKDNNTLEQDFYIFVKSDLGLRNFFEPLNNDLFDLLEDSLFTTLQIQNYGRTAQNNKTVTLIVSKDDSVYWSSSRSLSLNPVDSRILSFDPYHTDVPGTFQLIAFIENHTDSFSSNDTLQLQFRVRITKDAGIDTILNPDSLMAFDRKLKPTCIIKNFGELTIDSVPVYCEIWKDSSLVYKDFRFRLDAAPISTRQIPFKEWQPELNNNNYRALFFTQVTKDQITKNDTLATEFKTKASKDLSIQSFQGPNLVQSNQFFNPSFEFYNLGVDLLNGIYKVLLLNDTQIIDTLRFELSIATNESIILNSLDSLKLINGQHNLCAILQIDDLNPKNDTLCFSIFSRYQKDLSISIKKPQSNSNYLTQTDTFSIHVEVKNLGSQVYNDNEDIKLLLFNELDTTIKNITLNKTLASEETISFTWSNLRLKDKGNYFVEAQLSGSIDDYNVNNFDSISLFSIIQTDFEIDTFDIGIDTIYKNRPVLNSFIIKNNSNSNGQTRVKYSVIYTLNGQIYDIKEDSIEILQGTQKREILDQIIFNETGPLQVNVFIFNPKDQISSNDTVRIMSFVNSSSSIKYIKNNAIQIYPNPTANKLYMVSEIGLNAYQVLSINGKILAQKELDNNKEYEIDLSHFDQGNYILQINTDAGLVNFPIIKIE